MADFRSCIDDHAGKGEITPDVAARARKTYDEARATADESFGPADADRMAADAVMRQLEIDAIEAKRRRALMIRARTVSRPTKRRAATSTPTRSVPGARRAA